MSEGCDHFAHLLSILGLYVLVLFLYNTLRSPFLIVKALVKGLLVRGKNSDLVARYGSWAVITGSTDGIGKCYARELARKGLNVVLIARTKDKLVRCAEEIEQEFGVQARWIQADFSKGAPMYKHIEEELRDIPVGILVNNVGCTYGQLDALGDVSEEGLWNVVNTNVGAVTIMCRMVINKMKDGRGAIVNVSSATATQPGPYGAVYSASKAYISNLTDSLQYEYSHLNIDFQLLSPFFVTTKINSYSESIMSGGLFIPDAETYARQAVFTLGKTDDTCGYFWHAVQRTVVNMTSYRVRGALAYIIASRLKNNQTFSQEMTR